MRNKALTSLIICHLNKQGEISCDGQEKQKLITVLAWDYLLEQWKMMHGWTLKGETFRAILEREPTSFIKEKDSTLNTFQIIIF